MVNQITVTFNNGDKIVYLYNIIEYSITKKFISIRFINDILNKEVYKSYPLDIVDTINIINK